MALNIPKQIELGGLTITTKLLTEEGEGEKNTIGKADYKNLQIIIDTTLGVHEKHLEQIYYHELCHWIFYVMDEHEMQKNEKLIEVFSHFLYQSIGKISTFNSDK